MVATMMPLMISDQAVFQQIQNTSHPPFDFLRPGTSPQAGLPSPGANLISGAKRYFCLVDGGARSVWPVWRFATTSPSRSPSWGRGEGLG